MIEWQLNPDQVSMTLWENGKPKAIIEHQLGIDLITGNYYLVANKFHVLFYKDYFNGAGTEYDDNLRVFVPRAFMFDSLDESIKWAEEYIKYPFPSTTNGIVSDQIKSYIKNKSIKFNNDATC